MAFVAFVLAQLVLSNSLSLFGRQFWLDEIATQFVVYDPSLGHALDAVKGGVDTNPPTLHLLLRALTQDDSRGSREVTLRFLVLLFALSGLLGVYALLRQSFHPLASLAGCLAVWCHPLFLHQAFEARFYGAWLAGTVWYAYFLTRARHTSGPWVKIMLAVTAAFVCTVHYFGIIAVGSVTLLELLLRPRGEGRQFSRLLPVLLGPAALLACLPIYASQRAAFTVPTWVDPPTADLAERFAIKLLFPAYLAVVAVLPWFTGLWRSRRAAEVTPRSCGDLSLQAGMTGLVLMPVALIVFSFTVQSVLVSRYGLPAVAALAPVVAYAVSRTNRGWALALCAFLALESTREMELQAFRYRERDAASNQLMETLRTRTSDGAVVFERVHQLLVVGRYAPDVARRCYHLDFERDQIPDARDFRIMCRDLVRQYNRFYQTPALMKWAEVQGLSKFYLVFDPGRPLGDRPERAFPGFTARHIHGRVYEMTRSSQSTTRFTTGGNHSRARERDRPIFTGKRQSGAALRH